MSARCAAVSRSRRASVPSSSGTRRRARPRTPPHPRGSPVRPRPAFSARAGSGRAYADRSRRPGSSSEGVPRAGRPTDRSRPPRRSPVEAPDFPRRLRDRRTARAGSDCGRSDRRNLEDAGSRSTGRPRRPCRTACPGSSAARRRGRAARPPRAKLVLHVLPAKRRSHAHTPEGDEILTGHRDEPPIRPTSIGVRLEGVVDVGSLQTQVRANQEVLSAPRSAHHPGQPPAVHPRGLVLGQRPDVVVGVEEADPLAETVDE